MTSTLTDLRKLNPHVKILRIEDPSFCHFGSLHSGAPLDVASTYAREHTVIGESVVYEARVAGLEEEETLLAWLTWRIYGGMRVQLGWCYGRNQSLDGLEYHKGNEVIIAITDLLLLLGHYDDIQWQPQPSYDSARIKAFYVPQGSRGRAVCVVPALCPDSHQHQNRFLFPDRPAFRYQPGLRAQTSQNRRVCPAVRPQQMVDCPSRPG